MAKAKSKATRTPKSSDDVEWEKRWTQRLAALESAFGKSDPKVGHSVFPFEFGAEMGGAADIVSFSRHTKGKLYVTAELIGNAEQKKNVLGNYELAICVRISRTNSLVS